MKAKVFEASVYAGMQMICYFLLTLNFRAVAAANIPMALTTDACYAAFAFFVIRRIAKSEDSVPGFTGYVCGSMVGTFFGILISK